MPDRMILARFLEDVAVASTGSVETGALPCDTFTDLLSLSIWARSASGTADVKVEYATSHDGVNFDDYAQYTDLCASTATVFASAPEGWNVIPLAAPLNRFVKFKITGVGSNPADTLVSLLGHARENLACYR